ncbi:uncharacterized protein LOC122536151 isoform X1 [Frieseomelitta varia]|uniref:uncharacterized protein LOC122536151 isoform X1 n=1 Tax=Frieseomelitta varia TaxID=561572 RepID=UPI001CB6A074|nr:uncharacterized protein LOC122536151 isoform X1 [Frieseomelitta varia]
MNFVVITSIIMFSVKVLDIIQCISDESQKYFYIPYTVEWYNLSLSIQKLLLFIMQGNHHSAVIKFLWYMGTYVRKFEHAIQIMLVLLYAIVFHSEIMTSTQK